MHNALASVADDRASSLAPVGISSRVDRVSQDLVDRVVHRQLPGNLPSVNTSAKGPKRKLDAFMAEPQEDLANAAQLGEFAEHMTDSIPHPLVGVHRDRVTADLHISGREVQEQFATRGLLPAGVVGSLTQDRTFHLADGTFHTKQQPIVR